MTYLVFDLDGTLGDFTILWKVLCNLRQESFFKRFPDKIKPMPNQDFEWQLSIAYEAFVKQIAAAETSDAPLGIFRPGIFDLFAEIVKMKKNGKCSGAIIYTNNGSLSLVECVRDVINTAMRYKVFDDVLYYYHPIRIRRNPVPNPRKTWDEMKTLLVDSECAAPLSVDPHEVMFFDDQMHHELMGRLGANYVKVSEYKAACDVEALLKIYTDSLRKGEIFDSQYDHLFLEYCKGCPGYADTNDTMDKHIEAMRGAMMAVPRGQGGFDYDSIVMSGALRSVKTKSRASSSNYRALLPKKSRRKQVSGRAKSRKALKRKTGK
jgi:predicted phosphatase